MSDDILSLGNVYAKLLDLTIEGGDGIRVEDFIPNRCYILVQPLPKKTQVGSLHLPVNAEISRTAAVVVRVPECSDCEFEEGDLIYYAEHAGRPITIEGKQYEIIHYAADYGGDVYGRVSKAVLDRCNESSSLTSDAVAS